MQKQRQRPTCGSMRGEKGPTRGALDLGRAGSISAVLAAEAFNLLLVVGHVLVPGVLASLLRSALEADEVPVDAALLGLHLVDDLHKQAGLCPSLA